jgi:DNA-binding NarL/FixJ family response regulator
MNRPPDKNDRPQPPVKIVIVEDESWMGENLARELNGTSEFRCVNKYRTAEEALQGIPADLPDVVLMDINLPGMDGVECVRRLRANFPELRCLMLTVYEESEKIFKSLLAGANGYMLKRTSTPNLLEAIRQTYSGGAPMSSSIARKVVAYFNEMGRAQSSTVALSPRELQVLELLAKGAAYKQIADQLSLSIETIRMNVKHIYTKLHVHSRGEATVKYLQQSQFRHPAASKKRD